MPVFTWIPFAPALDTKPDQRTFLEYAHDLCAALEGCELDSRKIKVHQIRRSLAERLTRNRSAIAVQATALLLADLVSQGWGCRVKGKVVEVIRPEAHLESTPERDRVRRQLHVERDRQLTTGAVREFLARMERRHFYRGKWVSVFSLMRDGVELAERLRRLRNARFDDSASISRMGIIKPYIQIVSGDEACEHTGLPLLDIWRYFRHTWANPYKSVPGRSLMILVRDAAVEPHPVIGIAALASSAVQIGVRDKWIGWTPEDYVDQLRQTARPQHVRWLQQLIKEGLRDIYQDDLLDPALSPLTRCQLKSPTVDALQWLEQFAKEQREEHVRHTNASEHKRNASSKDLTDQERWRFEAETPLFRGKRAETLAQLLRAHMILKRAGEPLIASKLKKLLEFADARQAIQSLIRRAKSERVGIAMADISVCGAIAPYSHLLGGKLVAMLMASPEIIKAYRDRYGRAESVIASSLAGRPIVRLPHLVFLGTTSLYATEPTQYTRIQIPCEAAGGRQGESIQYKLLGKTEGYGTYQFSPETVDALDILSSRQKGGQKVHSIFGEGVNPRLRKIRDGLECLGLPADVLLEHGSPRLVYGIALARNFREYLLGLDQKPQYFFPYRNPAAATARIADWWGSRWLAGRIMRDDVLAEVATHQLTHPIKHGARVPIPEDPSRTLSLFDDLK